MEDPKKVAAVSAEIVMSDKGHPGGLRLSFAGGKGGALVLTAGMLSDGILEYAVWHGLKQKLVDAAAISRNPDTGRSATIEDKYNAVKTVYDRILAGQWNAERGDGSGTGGLLFRALCRMYPAKTPEALREFLAGKSKEDQAALRKNPKVAAIIEELKAEVASSKSMDVDTDAMLDELTDE